MLPQEGVVVHPSMRSAHDEAGVGPHPRGEGHDLALREAGLPAWVEGLHPRRRDAEVGSLLVGDAVLVGSPGGAPAPEVAIDDDLLAAVPMQDVGALVAQDEPEVVDAVATQGRADHRRVRSEPEAHAVDAAVGHPFDHHDPDPAASNRRGASRTPSAEARRAPNRSTASTSLARP